MAASLGNWGSNPCHPPSPQQTGPPLKGLVSGEALFVFHLSTIALEAGAGSTVGPSKLMRASGISTFARLEDAVNGA